MGRIFLLGIIRAVNFRRRVIFASIFCFIIVIGFQNCSNAGFSTQSSLQAETPSNIGPPVIEGSYVNILSNTQFQISTGMNLGSNKMNYLGTGSLPQFTVNSISSNGSTVTVNITPGDNQIYPNVLVQLGAGCDSQLRPIQAGSTGLYTALRVLTVSGNPVSSFTILAPLGATSFSPSSCLGSLVASEDLVGNSGNTADRWKKTPTALAWLEDSPQDNDPGAIREIGIQTTSNSPQYLCQELDPSLVTELQGQSLTFGARVMQRVQVSGGISSGAQAQFLIDGTFYKGTSTSSLNTYQWISQTQVIPTTAQSIQVCVAFNDGSGSVFYVAKPIAAIAQDMPANYYSQPQAEKVVPVVLVNTWDIYGSSIKFPIQPYNNSAYAGCAPCGYYGFMIDFYGETGGAVHWTTSSWQGDIEIDVPATSSLTPVTAFGLVSVPGVYETPGSAWLYPSVLGVTASATQNLVLVNGQAFFVSGASGQQADRINIDIFGFILNLGPVQ